MKKPKLNVDDPQPRNIQRADIAPSDGYALVVDGHFKRSLWKRELQKKRQPSCLRSIRCCRSKLTTHPRSHEPWLSSSKPALQQR
jgi:hypothetical protein